MSPLLIVTEAFTLIFLSQLVLHLLRAHGRSKARDLLVVAIVILVLSAMAWLFVPSMAERRWDQPPGGQAAAMLLAIVFLSGISIMHANGANRELMSQIAFRFAGWRIGFGLLILALGMQGQLPAAFFWPVALGDIAVGLLALAIRYFSASAPGPTLLLVWNLVGLADFGSVLFVGITVLNPAMSSGLEFSPPNFLPLVAVPLFIAMHVGGLAALRRTLTRSTP